MASVLNLLVNSWEGGGKQQHPKSQTEKAEPLIEKKVKRVPNSLRLDTKRAKQRKKKCNLCTNSDNTLLVMRVD